MADTDWLAGLQARDEVAVYKSAAGGGYFDIRRVIRATKKNIYVEYEGAFRQNCKGNNGWSHSVRCSIRPVTPEIRAQLQDEHDRSVAIRRLERDRPEWRKLTTDQLRRIEAILDEGQESKSPENKT